jgi:hypothetical protein
LPDALNNQDLMQAALVTVKVNVCRRGLPEDLALIYSMEDEEVSKAIAACQVKTDEADPEVSVGACISSLLKSNSQP